jgi:hypothetical protein
MLIRFAWLGCVSVWDLLTSLEWYRTRARLLLVSGINRLFLRADIVELLLAGFRWQVSSL